MAQPEFQHLVDRYYEPLYRFAFSLSGNRDDACDLAQQTFFIWARQGHGLRDAAKAKSWLFTTLYREFLKLHRHGRRLTLMEEPELDNAAGETAANWIGRLDGPTVIAAVQGVDDIYRAPLVLFYLQEHSYKEIADVLGVPIGTVMSRLSRGKEQLRRILRTRNERTTGGKVVPWPEQPHPRPHHG